MVANPQTIITGINLDDYAGRLSRLGPALDKIGLYGERQLKLAIARGRKLSGEPLAPLAPSTKAEKRRRGKARGILRRDGQLAASITSTRTSGSEVQIGTNLGHAPWVILGTRPYKIRPKRKPTLVFYTADGWRSAKEVNHPGLPERNIFEGADQVIGPYATATISAYLETGEP
ncbi:MAG: phage virion morphogenesis protein [Leptolyngbyaceae cyanobacterium]